MSTPSFVSSLSDGLRQRLLAMGSLQTLADGEQLIRQGDVSTHLYVVETGAVCAVTPHAPVPITSGDVVGEMAFLDNRPRTATVLCRGGATRTGD